MTNTDLLSPWVRRFLLDCRVIDRWQTLTLPASKRGQPKESP